MLAFTESQAEVHEAVGLFARPVGRLQEGLVLLVRVLQHLDLLVELGVPVVRHTRDLHPVLGHQVVGRLQREQHESARASIV